MLTELKLTLLIERWGITKSIIYCQNHFGGSNDDANIVKLTAREHFICHWLLVKMYDKGSDERRKMLCALWRMNHGSKNHKEHYTNARAYEKLRIEYANNIGLITSVAQSGNKNSQFGKKWYTNRNTSESKSFFEKPSDVWVKGRNLFRGECTNLEITRNSDKYYAVAKQLWNDYHSGNYSSIRDYCRKTSQSLKFIMCHLNRIPAYHAAFVGRSHNNCSKKEFVNVFEA